MCCWVWHTHFCVGVERVGCNKRDGWTHATAIEVGLPANVINGNANFEGERVFVA